MFSPVAISSHDVFSCCCCCCYCCHNIHFALMFVFFLILLIHMCAWLGCAIFVLVSISSLSYRYIDFQSSSEAICERDYCCTVTKRSDNMNRINKFVFFYRFERDLKHSLSLLNTHTKRVSSKRMKILWSNEQAMKKKNNALLLHYEAAVARRTTSLCKLQTHTHTHTSTTCERTEHGSGKNRKKIIQRNV